MAGKSSKNKDENQAREILSALESAHKQLAKLDAEQGTITGIFHDLFQAETKWFYAVDAARAFGLERLSELPYPDLEKERQTVLAFIEEPSGDGARFLIKISPEYLSKPYFGKAIRRWRTELVFYKRLKKRGKESSRVFGISARLGLIPELSHDLSEALEEGNRILAKRSEKSAKEAEKTLKAIGKSLIPTGSRGVSKSANPEFVVRIYHLVRKWIKKHKNLSRAQLQDLLEKAEKDEPAIIDLFKWVIGRDVAEVDFPFGVDIPSDIARLYVAEVFGIDGRTFDNYRREYRKTHSKHAEI